MSIADNYFPGDSWAGFIFFGRKTMIAGFVPSTTPAVRARRSCQRRQKDRHPPEVVDWARQYIPLNFAPTFPAQLVYCF
jgi:hypothetical protein